jgi:hypothetical protein
MSLQLRFREVVVGEILDPYFSDNTGYGRFRASPPGGGETERRIRGFIAFSKDWHARLKAGANPDASEFDAFLDLVESGLWHTASPDGTVRRIKCPLIVEAEITWRPATEPTASQEAKAPMTASEFSDE